MIVSCFQPRRRGGAAAAGVRRYLAASRRPVAIFTFTTHLAQQLLSVIPTHARLASYLIKPTDTHS